MPVAAHPPPGSARSALQRPAVRARLVWRMVWFFACPRHHCLCASLRNAAPPQRRGPVRVLSRNRDTARPVTLRRRTSVFDAARTSRRQRSSPCPRPARCSKCKQSSPRRSLHDQANFGIYQSNPTPVPQVLADVRCNRGQVSAALDRGAVSPRFPAAVMREYRDL